VAAAAGCGSSSSSGTSADPATVIPASAVLYAGATVRPEGALQAAAAADGRALAHEADPYLHLVAELQTPGSPSLQYARDVEPWLGPHAGLFLSSVTGTTSKQLTALLPTLLGSLTGAGTTGSSWPFSTAGLQGAVVLDTSDLGRARTFLSTQAAHAGATASTYRGVALRETSSGVAFASVDRFAVIGSGPAVKAVIDTALGGAALDRSSSYRSLLASAPAGALGHVFEASGAFGSHPEGMAAFLGVLGGGGDTNVSIVPSASSLEVDVDGAASGQSASAARGLLYSGQEAAQALGELPGESWLALGLGNVGPTLAADVKGLEGLSALGSSLGATKQSSEESSSTGAISIKGLSVQGLLKGLLTPLEVMGADTPMAKRVFTSWMGPTGIFAGGSGLLELEGGVVIDSKNAAASKAAVAALAAGLQKAGASVQTLRAAGTEASVTASINGLPLLLVIAAGRDSAGQAKFVIGLGSSSVSAALDPANTLAGSSAAQSATKALGGARPGLIVSVPTVLELLEGAGLAEDPTISKLVPALRSVMTVSGGDQTVGAIRRFKLLIGLHQSG
jgi:hypothetical protein